VKEMHEPQEVQRTQPEGPERELDVEEASDKPRRDVVTERRSLRDGIVP
jgi:hypothetical protein